MSTGKNVDILKQEKTTLLARFEILVTLVF